MKLPPQSDISLEAINRKIWEHLVARGWENNKPRSLAVSIALEANELLEHYQWSDEPVGSVEDLGEELADIFIYAFQFAQVHNIDIAAMIDKKLTIAAKKYPAEQFKNKNGGERRKAWYDAKLGYKKEGL